MPTAAYWTDRLREALGRFTEGLLRSVAGRLLKPRTKKPLGDLRDEMAAFPDHPIQIDRRLKELPEAGRTLLALMDLSRQPAWRLGGLLELLSATLPAGAPADGMAVVFALLEAGFLYPTLPEDGPKLRSFEEWLGRGLATQFELFTHPAFARRAGQAAPGWPTLPASPNRPVPAGPVQETDGLELPLRLGCLWQAVRAAPLRLTQQGDFYKRDADRLAEPLFAGPWDGERAPLPAAGAGLAALGLGLGFFAVRETDLTAAPLPAAAAAREATTAGAVEQIVALLPSLSAWTAFEGWRGLQAPPSPYASAAVLALALLRSLPEEAWATPGEVADWIGARHCWWTGLRPAAEAGEKAGEPAADAPPSQARGFGELQEGMAAFLAGFAQQLRLTQWATDEAGAMLVRLSPFGRAILSGQTPPAGPEFAKTLLVQPNLEILAYRQGLTPALIVDLTSFAEWKTLGSACTLALTPASVYRGLESGGSFESIQQTLQRRGVKELPENVLQSLRTWANKRDRITVYAAAALLEFAAAEDLEAALSRGVGGERLAERFLLVPSEEELQLRHFRLLATRDYSQPPGQCVTVGEDGLSLTADLAKADLLLDAELSRFAEAGPAQPGVHTQSWSVTPESLRRARQSGLTLRALEEWFPQRTGQPLSSAARLFYAAADQPPLAAQPRVTLETPTAELADGLWQWPAARLLLEARLGPAVLAANPEKLLELRRLLAELSWELVLPEAAPPAPPPMTGSRNGEAQAGDISAPLRDSA